MIRVFDIVELHSIKGFLDFRRLESINDAYMINDHLITVNQIG